jgi:hypothetical protein
LDKHTTLNAAECSWLQSRQNKKGGNLTEKRNNKREEEEEDRRNIQILFGFYGTSLNAVR